MNAGLPARLRETLTAARVDSAEVRVQMSDLATEVQDPEHRDALIRTATRLRNVERAISMLLAAVDPVAEQRRLVAISAVGRALAERGIEDAWGHAAEVVDSITDHAVETVRDLMRAEEALGR
jgi:hypothetical protein